MSWAIITKKKISHMRSFLVFSSTKSMLHSSPPQPTTHPQLPPKRYFDGYSCKRLVSN